MNAHGFGGIHERRKRWEGVECVYIERRLEGANCTKPARISGLLLSLILEIQYNTILCLSEWRSLFER